MSLMSIISSFLYFMVQYALFTYIPFLMSMFNANENYLRK